MIVSSSAIGAQWFLNGINNLQNQITKTSNELSSGYQVNTAADSPEQTAALVDLGSKLAATQTYQQNLTTVQNETQTADQSLAAAISLVQQARSVALEATGTNVTPSGFANMATQVQGIQQQIVSVANTSVGGRYVFGGDQSTSAPYQYDPTSATSSVDKLTPQTATYSFVSPDGATIYQTLSAAHIFDDQDAQGNPTANNVFVALQSLNTALQNNDVNGVTTALTSLETASEWLNQQQGYYGAAGQRITTEQNNAANTVTSLKVGIGSIRDTDIVAAATDLTRETAAESAAFEAQAAIPQKSLFDYLG